MQYCGPQVCQPNDMQFLFLLSVALIYPGNQDTEEYLCNLIRSTKGVQ